MNSVIRVDSATSADATDKYRPDSERIVVGGCAALTIVPVRELQEYYQGYRWASIAGGAIAILFAIALWALE